METLSTKSTVVCWDNSTRGLDSSTALDYAKSLRVMTDISNRKRRLLYKYIFSFTALIHEPPPKGFSLAPLPTLAGS